MKLRIESLAQQAHRHGGVGLPVHDIMTDQAMEVDMLTGDGDIARNILHLLNMAGTDLRLSFRQSVSSVVVCPLYVGAGDCQKHTADIDITHVLRLKESRLHTGAHLWVVGDLPLADARRAGLSQSENLD